VERTDRMLRLAAALLASVLALGCGGSARPAEAPAQPPAAAPAAPAAPAAVGILQFTVTTAPDRALPAMVWYPAERPGNGAPPLLGRKRPVLVISHGLGGRKEHAAFIADRAAAAGYIVAAVDHQNDGQAMVLQRPVDVTKLLDRLADRAAEPAWLADLADLEHVAVYGHSFGGYTALALAGAKIGPNPEWTAFCAAVPPPPLGCPAPAPDQMKTTSLRDRRVDAAIAATPAGFFQFGKAGTAAVEVPVLLLAGGKDQITPAASFVHPLFEHMKMARWYVELELAGHMTFVELCDKVGKMPEPFDSEVRAQCAADAPLPLRTAQALIADLVVAALDHTLKGAPAPDLAALARSRGIAVRAEAAR
jgi:predicted dienelactone hydrolase